MRHGFVIDPLETLLPAADTTIAFMREAESRGHEVYTCNIGGLGLAERGRPYAHLSRTRLVDGEPWYRAEPGARQPLDELDVVWMRKDPPFDMSFFYATHLLSMVAKPTLVVNDPAALLEANEKLFALRFPELCPESLVSRSMRELMEFRARLDGEMIVKPLGGAGGSGIFHIRPDDRNVNAILEMSTRHEQEWLLAQRYLPEIRDGDKRVILVEGEPVGAVLRVPDEAEARANFHAGGQARRAAVDDRDREIGRRIGPVLREMGIVFAGIDVIGEWLTEINVTSPTGIREIYDLEGIAIEPLIVDAVLARVARANRPA